VNSYIEKTVPGKDGEPQEIQLVEKDNGQQKCGPGCHWRHRHSGNQFACFLFGAGHGACPHPNCLAPGIKTGPVEHGNVKQGDIYFMTSMRHSISRPVAKIKIDSVRKHKTFVDYVDIHSEFKLPQPLSITDFIYTKEKPALEKATEIMREELKKIEDKIKKIREI